MKDLDKRTKWCYCIGATGRDMAYTLVSMYLLTYIQYTMKLSAAQFAVISGCIVVCLIWDAINDPMMGIIIENSNLKRGKFKPWIMAGAILNALVIVALFTFRPEGWGFVAFFAVGYLLWGMTYTMNDIAYWGMLPSLSSNQSTRNTLVTLMGIFICIGQFTVAGVVPTLVAGNAVTVYKWAAVIIAICFIAFQALTFFGAKERPREENKAKLSLKDMFKIFGRNDQLVSIGVSSLIFNIGNGLLILFAVNFFYFEYGYEEGGNLVFLFTVMYGLGTLISEALFAVLSKHFKRMQLILFCVVALFVGYAALLMFGYVIPKSVILICIIGFVIFFAQGLFNLVIVVMLNNTIEYDEYNTGERHDSIISAVRSFSAKLGTAIDQGIVSLVLIISGIYNASQQISSLEIQSGQGVITQGEVFSQAAGIVQGVAGNQTLMLRIGMVVFPLIAFIIAYFAIKKKYKIDEAEYDRIVTELEARKASN